MSLHDHGRVYRSSSSPASWARLVLTVVPLWWVTPGAAADPAWWQVAAVTQGMAWCAVAEVVRRARGAPGSWMTSGFLLCGLCLLAAAVLSASMSSASVPSEPGPSAAGLPPRVVADLAWVGLALAPPTAMVGFPGGAPRTRPDRVTAGVLLVLGVVGLDPGGALGSVTPGTDAVRGACACSSVVVLAAALWWRGEHADGDVRVALLWVALGAGVAGLLLGHLVFVAAPEGRPEPPVVVVGVCLGLLVPTSVAVGLVVPRRADVRRLIGTVAVSVVMVDLTVAVVAGSLAALSWATGDPPTKGAVAVVATGAAVAFGPTLVRVRRVVEEVLFGGSSDPLEAMSRLGAELGADSSPDAWVAALRTALVVPRVELWAGGQLLAAAGAPEDGTGVPAEATALRVGGEHVGDLVVTPPTDATGLPRSTRAVLGIVAAPLARALQAVRLAEDLHVSRERVVQAREEERRRLRRDLHDGLGPVLTGVAYTADAATNLLRSDPDHAEVLLGQLRADTADAIQEIRRIVHGLRPPALDEVGLAGALRQHVLRYAGAVDVDLRCTVMAAESPGGLPAAVEVVAYRVAVEALTNAARHALPAGRAAPRVSLDLDLGASGTGAPELVVSVRDDGSGQVAWTAGAGVVSMLERCDEVGGVVVAGPTPAGGRVVARLPVRRELARPVARPAATGR